MANAAPVIVPITTYGKRMLFTETNTEIIDPVTGAKTTLFAGSLTIFDQSPRRSYMGLEIIIEEFAGRPGQYACAILGILGLQPDRTVTAEENGRGLKSLETPFIEASGIRETIDRAMECVALAVEATVGSFDSIAEILAIRYRVGIAVRGEFARMGFDT